MNVPTEMLKRIRKSGRQQAPHMCMGVEGRGDLDEEEWEEDVDQEDSEEDTMSTEADRKNVEKGQLNALPKEEDAFLAPALLSEFMGDQVVTTRCDNKDAVIEWLFVPFIVEEDEASPVNDDEASDEF